MLTIPGGKEYNILYPILYLLRICDFPRQLAVWRITEYF